MGNFEKIFREFLYLNDGRIWSEKKKLSDIILEGNYVLRVYEYTSTIYFLVSSDSITIPNLFIDIFTNFDTEYSGKSAELISSPGVGKREEILRLSLLLSRDLKSNQLFYRTDTILGYIEKIVNLGGTKIIRDIVKEVSNLKLDPWVIENLNTTIEV